MEWPATATTAASGKDFPRPGEDGEAKKGKQEEAVGAAASKTKATAKRMLGAATRLSCPKRKLPVHSPNIISQIPCDLLRTVLGDAVVTVFVQVVLHAGLGGQRDDVRLVGGVPALDHDWDDWKVTKKATCTETGVKTRTCKRDSSHTDTETIDKTEHTAVVVPAKAATCTETGLTVGSKCQRCEKILTAQETIPALGHDWNTTSTGVDNCVNVSFRHENETITLCPICGVQNGTQRLNKVTLYTAHAKLVVLRGVLENGMEAMTVAFYEPGISSVTACQRCGAVRDSFSSGASLPQAAENAHFTVDASLVDGYTVMLVQADGTETVLTPGISDGKAIFDVDMKGQGARLLHLVPTTAA